MALFSGIFFFRYYNQDPSGNVRSKIDNVSKLNLKVISTMGMYTFKSRVLKTNAKVEILKFRVTQRRPI